MEINRIWAMPNKRTFQIKPITNIILKYNADSSWIDPFPYHYTMDALSYLKAIDNDLIQGVLFDPPYSPRQLKECYKNIGQSLHDTTSRVWSEWKKEIARVIKPKGYCISFGWNSGGIGKKLGFKIIEILLVPHGGNHNDTIVTVEKKIQTNLMRR